MVDRALFFSKVRVSLFKGRMLQSQTNGLTTLLDAWDAEYASEDLRWLAYVLATTHHETAATMQPIREYGRGKGRRYGKADPETNQVYYGRGYCQLTWRRNYEAMTSVVGVDLVANPDLALEPDVAAKILYHGMMHGTFTGKKLSRYFNDEASDWVNARRIINGTDRAGLIAAYGKKYLAALQEAPVEQPAEKKTATTARSQASAGGAGSASPQPQSTFANGRGIAHKGSGGMTMAFPDVCLTPAGPAVVPIPYPSMAKSADTSKGPKTVTTDGQMPMVKGAEYAVSMGDEAGTNKGVMSGTNMGPCDFMLYSFDVKMEGDNACRLGDSLFHNKRNAVGGTEIGESVVVPKFPPPCDVTMLALKATFPKADEPPISLSASKLLRGQPVEGEVTERLKHDLASYDLVLEFVAPFEDASADRKQSEAVRTGAEGSFQRETAKPVKLEITTAIMGSCEPGLHPHLAAIAVPAKEARDVKGESLSLEVLADAPPGTGADRGFGAGSIFFKRAAPKVIAVSSTSCGERGGARSVQELRALVRAYAEDAWELEIQSRGRGSASYSKSFTRSLDGRYSKDETEKKWSRTTEESRSSDKTEVIRDQQKGSHYTTVDGRRGDVSYTGTTGTKEGKDISEHAITWRGMTTTYVDGGQTLAKADVSGAELAEGWSIKLTRNGQSLPFLDLLNSLKKVVVGWNEAMDFIRDYLPSVGWSFAAQVDVLQGSLTLKMGNRRAERSGPRYTEVETYFDAVVRMAFLKGEVSLTGGLKCNLLVFHLEATLTAKVKLDILLEGTIEARNPSKSRVGVRASVPWEVRAVGRAILYGYGGNVEGAVIGGFEMEAVFKQVDGRAVLEREGTRSAIAVVAWCESYTGEEVAHSRRVRRELVPEKVIWPPQDLFAPQVPGS